MWHLGRSQRVGWRRTEYSGPAQTARCGNTALTERIQRDRDQDDDAAGEGLIIRRDPDQRLTLGQHGDERSAEQCSDQCPAAAEQTGSADDDGRDDVELLARAGFGCAGLQSRGENDAGQRRTEAADDIGAELDPRDADARQPRGQFAAAERIKMEPEPRAPQDERADAQQDGEDDKGYRDAEDIVLAEDQKILVGDDRA